MRIKTSEIIVNPGRREINPDKVSELAESISTVGLLNPITITKGNVLIAGLHRLSAVKQLGWVEVETNIVDITGLFAELAEIDENLIRNELHYIDRGNQLSRRKEIYEELYPDTKQGQSQALGMNKTIGNNVSAESAPTFVKDTSNKTGKSERTIHEELQIVKNIIPEVQEIIKNNDIAKTDALKISRLEPEKQKRIIEKAINKDISIKEAIIEIDNKPHVANNSGNNQWYTPLEYIDAAKAVMGSIDLDPASSEIANKIVGAKQIYTAENDGLTKDWSGKVFLNPPYAGELISLFCDKIAKHYKDGDIEEAIVLVNNATETNWFYTLISLASSVVFTKGRVKFYTPSGNIGAPLQGQAILYFGNNSEKFMRLFKKFGWGALL